jgi:hypothetical protein
MNSNKHRHAKTHERPPRLRSIALACGLAASGMVLLPRPAAAQQWLFTPEVELGAHHIDNPRLAEDVETEAITGGLVDAGLAMRRNTQTSSVLLRPRVAVYRYPDAPDEDSEAYFLDLNAGTETQRSSWDIRANYRQQQVYQGETTPADIDDGDVDDGIGIDDDVQTGTGRTFERRQRDLWRINPGAGFELTEVTSLRVDLSYLDVQYDKEELGEATDYNNSQVRTALTHALTPQSEISAILFGERYEPINVGVQSDSIGARVRYQHSLSDISTFFVDVGAQETQSEVVAIPDLEISRTGFLWTLGFDRQLEITRWRLEAGSDVTPSGSGLVERDMIRAIMDHQFEPRWSLRLAAVAMQTQRLAENIVRDQRDYLQGRATLAWQWTQSWTVETGYSLTHQDHADIPGDAQEHEIRLVFVYNPPLPTQ